MLHRQHDRQVFFQGRRQQAAPRWHRPDMQSCIIIVQILVCIGLSWPAKPRPCCHPVGRGCCSDALLLASGAKPPAQFDCLWQQHACSQARVCTRARAHARLAHGATLLLGRLKVYPSLCKCTLTCTPRSRVTHNSLHVRVQCVSRAPSARRRQQQSPGLLPAAMAWDRAQAK